MKVAARDLVCSEGTYRVSIKCDRPFFCPPSDPGTIGKLNEGTDLPEKIIVYDKGYRFDRDGWIYIHIEGEPYERGIQYGYLAAPELKDIMKNIRYLTYWDTGKDWQFFVNASEELFIPNIDQEYLQEIKGIAKGANAMELTSLGRISWPGTAI